MSLRGAELSEDEYTRERAGRLVYASPPLHMEVLQVRPRRISPRISPAPRPHPVPTSPHLAPPRPHLRALGSHPPPTPARQLVLCLVGW